MDTLARRSRARTALLLVTLTAAAAALNGCGAASSDTTAATGSSSASTEESEGETSEWAEVVALNEALAEEDYDRAAALVAPSSAAGAYVDYRTQVATAIKESGTKVPRLSAEVSPDSLAGSVAVEIRQADGQPYADYTWQGFEADDAGLITTWQTELGPLGDQIRSEGEPVEGGGATVSVDSAFQTTAGDLYVVLSITAQEATVTTDESAALITTEQQTVEPSAAIVPDEVPAGETGTAAYVYPEATLVGTVVYEVQTDFDAPTAVEVALPAPAS